MIVYVTNISYPITTGGGTGFIGKNLGELLMANGYNVVNVARMPATTNISWSTLELSGLPKRTCAVVNCAGQQFMDFTKSWTPGYVCFTSTPYCYYNTANKFELVLMNLLFLTQTLFSLADLNKMSRILECIQPKH